MDIETEHWHDGGGSLTFIDGDDDNCDRTQRWQINPVVLSLLNQVYAMEPFPSTEVRKQLAAKLKVHPRQVQTWFQNRRARERRLGGIVPKPGATGALLPGSCAPAAAAATAAFGPSCEASTSSVNQRRSLSLPSLDDIPLSRSGSTVSSRSAGGGGSGGAKRSHAGGAAGPPGDFGGVSRALDKSALGDGSLSLGNLSGGVNLCALSSSISKGGSLARTHRFMQLGWSLERATAAENAPVPNNAPVLPGNQLRLMVWAEPPHALISASLPFLRTFGVTLDSLHSSGATIDVFSSQPEELEELRRGLRGSEPVEVSMISAVMTHGMLKHVVRVQPLRDSQQQVRCFMLETEIVDSMMLEGRSHANGAGAAGVNAFGGPSQLSTGALKPATLSSLSSLSNSDPLPRNYLLSQVLGGGQVGGGLAAAASAEQLLSEHNLEEIAMEMGELEGHELNELVRGADDELLPPPPPRPPSLYTGHSSSMPHGGKPSSSSSTTTRATDSVPSRAGSSNSGSGPGSVLDDGSASPSASASRSVSANRGGFDEGMSRGSRQAGSVSPHESDSSSMRGGGEDTERHSSPNTDWDLYSAGGCSAPPSMGAVAGRASCTGEHGTRRLSSDGSSGSGAGGADGGCVASRCACSAPGVIGGSESGEPGLAGLFMGMRGSPQRPADRQLSDTGAPLTDEHGRPITPIDRDSLLSAFLDI
mmetsp:Transcript_51320/g.133330  ORF Transcript_51320/g.133330 Transcript_51320/m.133330 type:complete len:703 (-) Transcript_51320:446-2554(-)